MDIRSNDPFWLVNNGLVKSYPSLDHPLNTEVLVIGGGITGSLIAYQLMKEGREVVLVDRRDICHGSTAASTAMLQYEIDLPLHKLIGVRGLDCAVSSYRNCEKAIFDLHNIVKEINSKCHFEFKKSIYFTSARKDVEMLKTEFEVRKQHGFDVTWLASEALKEMGLNALAGIESKSAAVVDPYRLASDLLKFCSSRGMRIFDRTEISKIKQKKDKLYADFGMGTIEASHVVHCSGYESTNMLHEKVVDLKSTYALASEAFEKLPDAFSDTIFWDTASPYLYFRATADRRIIVGGGDVGFKNAVKRDSLLGRKQKFLLKQFQRCFPDICFKPDYCWAGTFGETEDGLPYIGRPKPDVNEHYALGFGGNGITYSVMAMDAIGHSLNHMTHKFLNDYGFDR